MTIKEKVDTEATYSTKHFPDFLATSLREGYTFLVLLITLV